MIIGYAPAMAKTENDTNEQAMTELRHGAGGPAPMYLDQALMPGVFDDYVAHVKQHAIVPDFDPDTDDVDPRAVQTPIVPLYVYGEGQHDYISTDFDAGQVLIRDGNDRTGRAWKFDEQSFRRFVLRAQGKKLPDDDEEAQGESPIEGAVRLARRTAKLVEADRQATERAEQGGAPVQLEKVDRPGGKPAGTKS